MDKGDNLDSKLPKVNHLHRGASRQILTMNVECPASDAL